MSYCGFEVLEPQVFQAPSCISEEERKKMLEDWVKRLQDIKNEKPIPLPSPEVIESGASEIPGLCLLHQFQNYWLALVDS